MNQSNNNTVNRPQEPKPPFPYNQEAVFFNNATDDVVLAGTLSLPLLHSFPAVILIAGYGPHTRDLTGMGHNYFRVLADYLVRRGIAVLRYDKRGAGESTGNYSTATSADFTRDVLAGTTYLKARTDLNITKIGLIGLSEGGLIASMVSAQSNDINFAVLMAPALCNSPEYLTQQAILQLRADGASQEFIAADKLVRIAVYNAVKNESDSKRAADTVKGLIKTYLAQLPEDQKKESKNLPFSFTQENMDLLVTTFNSPWYRYFLSCDPGNFLKQVTIPLLIMNGDKDWIASAEKVFSFATQTLHAAGNDKFTCMLMPNMNHMFQTCKTGALMEMATIQETIAPCALQTIADWIKQVGIR